MAMLYKTKACFALAGGDEGGEQERMNNLLLSFLTASTLQYLLRQFDSFYVWQSLIGSEVKLLSRTSTASLTRAGQRLGKSLRKEFR